MRGFRTAGVDGEVVLTQVAPGPRFGDGGHVFRLGFAFEPTNRLEKGLDVISAALDADPA